MPSSNTYPINPDLPQYLDVPIMHEGEISPCGVGGALYPVTFARLEAYAKSCDPVHWPAASLNFDHEGQWWGGPAYGVIAGLRAEKVAGRGLLLAHIANVPYWVGDMIDGGQYPYRSPEFIDAPFLAELWDMKVERLRYYGVEDYYVTALALMGQYLPAFPHLGPMPARYQPPADEKPEAEPIEIVILPLAATAAQVEHRRIAAFEFNPSKEALMGDTAQDKTRQGGSPPVNTAAQTTTAPATPQDSGDIIKAAAQQLGRSEAEVSRAFELLKAGSHTLVETGPVDSEATAHPKLTAALDRIKELEARDRERGADAEFQTLCAELSLLPAEKPLVELIVKACRASEDLSALRFMISARDDKGQDTPRETDMVGLLKQLLATRERPRGGVVTASHEDHVPGSQAQHSTAKLSNDDKVAAKALGYTEEEFARFKATKEIPARLRPDGGKSQEDKG
ncbi:hypothetical protein IT575_12150 [bacterium]|nr:hypothetical protein [bacterium]